MCDFNLRAGELHQIILEALGGKGHKDPTSSIAITWQWRYRGIHSFLEAKRTFPRTTGDVALALQPAVVAFGWRVHAIYANGDCIHNGGSDVITKKVVDHKLYHPWTLTFRWFNHYEYEWILDETLLFGMWFIGFGSIWVHFSPLHVSLPR